MARVLTGSHSFICHPHVHPSCLTPQLQSIAAIWPVLISRPAEDRRPSWPGSRRQTRWHLSSLPIRSCHYRRRRVGDSRLQRIAAASSAASAAAGVASPQNLLIISCNQRCLVITASHVGEYTRRSNFVPEPRPHYPSRRRISLVVLASRPHKYCVNETPPTQARTYCYQPLCRRIEQ